MNKSLLVGRYADIINKPDLELFYEEITRDWEYKARRLQARRWRKVMKQ